MLRYVVYRSGLKHCVKKYVCVDCGKAYANRLCHFLCKELLKRTKATEIQNNIRHIVFLFLSC